MFLVEIVIDIDRAAALRTVWVYAWHGIIMHAWCAMYCG